MVPLNAWAWEGYFNCGHLHWIEVAGESCSSAPSIAGRHPPPAKKPRMIMSHWSSSPSHPDTCYATPRSRFKMGISATKSLLAQRPSGRASEPVHSFMSSRTGSTVQMVDLDNYAAIELSHRLISQFNGKQKHI
jgi:hypothetical protein